MGARFDRVLAVYSNAVLALRGRVAWAHDWVSDPTLTPLFQALPGASFIVNGRPATELRAGVGRRRASLRQRITLLAKFDGEFTSLALTSERSAGGEWPDGLALRRKSSSDLEQQLLQDRLFEIIEAD